MEAISFQLYLVYQGSVFYSALSSPLAGMDGLGVAATGEITLPRSYPHLCNAYTDI